MARRRGAAPRMAPRRSAPVRQTKPAVAPQHQMQQQPAVQQKAPGMLANIASTALGVGIGHTIAHGLTGALSGDKNEKQPDQQLQQPQQLDQQQQYSQQQQYNQNPCGLEMENFFNCTQQTYDLSMCENLNNALRECKLRFSNQI